MYALRRSARICKLDRKTTRYIRKKMNAQDKILNAITRKKTYLVWSWLTGNMKEEVLLLLLLGIKCWYWPQGLLSMPTDNSHKFWETPSVLLLLLLLLGIKCWYWPQGLLSMPTDNSHKFWETPCDKTSVSSASQSDFLTSSIVIHGQCNFSCSGEERMKARPRRLKTGTFG